MAAYRALDAWVRAWEVPADVDLTSLPSAAGVAIILRLHGDVIARASETPGADGDPPLITAARAAIAEALRRLPGDNDALAEETRRQLAADVTISLELAGPLIPLGARTFEDAVRDLSPGVDGVAARFGARTASIFPSAMLMQSMSPRMALSSAAAQAGDDATLGLADMDKLIDKHGAAFYRFRVTHLAQGEPGSAPAFLYRGGREVALSEITARELHAMADRIAEHLLTRAWPGREPYGMTGAYDPCRDVNEPRIAAPIEQLVVALSLVRASRLVSGGDIQSPRAQELLAFVDRLLADLAKVETGEPDASTDPAAAAAWVVVAHERAALQPAAILSEPFAAQCRRTLLESFHMEEGFAPALAPAAQPLVALALVRLAAGEKPGAMRREAIMLADAGVRRVLRDASAGDLVGRMPWLGWAEIELAALKGEKGVSSVAALRQMRTLVWEHQLLPTDPAGSDVQGGGPDMAGGIVFDTGSREAAGVGRGLPTWQTARPVVFLATMLADERLTRAEERPLELARLISALRFLRQLQMDNGNAWMCQNRRKSLGGVRASTWDQRMPPDASAMTLLALCETIRALDVMAGK